MGKVVNIVPQGPRAPDGLGKAARAFWDDLVGEYGIADQGGLRTLELAARAFDRLDQARRLLDSEGLVVRDRWEQPKPHPAAQIERDSRMAVLRALQALHLDVEPIRDKIGRPGGR